MTGILIAGAGLGTMVVPPIANWLISTYGWRTSYFVVGITALIIMMIAAQFLRRDPSQVGQLPYGGGGTEVENMNVEVRGVSHREALHTMQFWTLLVVTTCLGFCLHVILVHIVPHATDLGISTSKAANIIAVIGGTSIIGKVMLGGAGDRFGNRRVIAICFAVMLFALVLLVDAEGLWIFYLFAAAFGIAYGGIIALQPPMVAELFGLHSHGAILGSTAFATTTGGAVGSVLAGHMFDTAGSYQGAFLACVGASVVGLIAALLLRPISQPEVGKACS